MKKMMKKATIKRPSKTNMQSGLKKTKFDNLDDAILWCQKNSYEYKVVDQTYKQVKPKSYASNFSNNRKTSWTH
jgi:hypothetical protein